MKNLSIVLLSLLWLGAVGCEDKMEGLEGRVRPAMKQLIEVVERDTKQIRDGMPKGVVAMSKHLPDPGSDLEGVKRAIHRSRAEVHDLAVAKSTFFALADTKGVIVRSETDPDLPAGKSLLKAIPSTAKAFGDKPEALETWGYMQGLRGVNKGDDLQWIVAHPVNNREGAPAGVFVTGWSLRKYAFYLQEQVKRHLHTTQVKKKKAIPLVYAFVVKGSVAYAGPITPDEQAKLVGSKGLVEKTKTGDFIDTLEFDKRSYMLLAEAAPALGADVVFALMVSPL